MAGSPSHSWRGAARISERQEHRELSRRAVLATTAATVGVGAFTGAARGAQENGHASQESDSIQEMAWVETGVDTDDSGDPDRIAVQVARPQSTAEGAQLPVVMVASPYYGEQTHSDATAEMMYDRAVAPQPEAGAGENAARSVAADAGGTTGTRARHHVAHAHQDGILSRYLSQGYVVARAASLGTHRSTGCYTAAGPPTLRALASVIDWFNGRGTAYDAREGGESVTADWTNGRTGMMGTSALGELANGVATTGVDGLEAIVPQAANASHYSLFRANGTPISVVPDESGDRMNDLGSWVQAGTAERSDCGHWAERVEAGQDRATGNYNDFWHEREFLTDADAVDAGVLMTHAVDDRTVKPSQFADWYETLQAADVPVRLWLHRGGHTAPHGERWIELLDRWWAYWLTDEDNGVMEEGPVWVDHLPAEGEEGPVTYDSWPHPDGVGTTVNLARDGTGVGQATVDGGESAEETFVDDPSRTVQELAEAEESTHRLRYETPPLSESVHVSGRVVPELAVSLDRPTVLSVALVEYTEEGADLVTRGWADPLNRPSYGEYDTPLAYKESLRTSEAIEPDEQVAVEFPLQPTEHVFQPGSRIGVVVYGSDRAFTLHPPGEATVTLSLAASSVGVPVVGGRSALEGAFGERATLTQTDGDSTSAGADDPTSESGDGFGALAVGSALAGLGAGGLLRGRGRDGGGE